MFEEYDDVLSVSEACEALKIGHNYMYKHLQNGVIGAYKVGKSWRIPKSSLLAFIQNNCCSFFAELDTL